MELWQAIADWLHKPFEEPLDPVNWILLVIMAATVTYAWTLVLDHVLEQ